MKATIVLCETRTPVLVVMPGYFFRNSHAFDFHFSRGGGVEFLVTLQFIGENLKCLESIGRM